MFRPDGTREVNKMIIEQYIMSTGQFHGKNLDQIGHIHINVHICHAGGVTREVVGRVLINGGNASLEYIDENITDLTIWPGTYIHTNSPMYDH